MPSFFRNLLEGLLQADKADWPAQVDTLAAIFIQRTCAEWCTLLEGTDACFAPVLELSEAITHPHMAARHTYVQSEGVVQPAPAPRFSRTPGAIQPTSDAATMLARWGA